jgi:uncharacterized protein YjbJ (UPF0337 family)
MMACGLHDRGGGRHGLARRRSRAATGVRPLGTDHGSMGAGGAATRPPSPHQETAMNKDTVQGQWKQLKGKMQAQWGKLTNDDLDVAEGNAEYLAGKIQERYGIARDEAQKQVGEFQRRL